MSLIKNQNIVKDMKEPLWIISNVCLIHTSINFPVFPQHNVQVGNSFEMTVSMWLFIVYNAHFSLAHCPVWCTR